MTEMFNFSEFYQKTPIPVCEKDQSAMQNENNHWLSLEPFTHWLIAVEGCEEKKEIQWRVAIYPSNEWGAFNYKVPFYRSPYYHSFHEAWEAIRELEKKAKQDPLLT